MAKIHINNPKQVINGGAKKYYFKVKGLGGPKGDKGDKGDTGSQGPQGPQGNAATVSVGSTTTLPVGQDATVQNVGTLYNAVLNFGIPQGPRGPQGATGATGAKGDKGDQGNPGPQGEKGTNATVYVGTTSTLNPGSQATVYNSGTDSNAVLNFGIPKGEKGDTGPMPTIAQSTGQATDQVMSQKATADALNTKQATITSSNKLSADLVTDTSTTNKFVTASDITNWNAKQDALTAGTGIDITGGVISTPAIVPEVVTELPTTGAEGKLYLTPKAHTTSTASGNPITATITDVAGQLESFQLDGDTFQQSYEGKNLVGIDGITFPFTNNGVTVTREQDGSYTFNGTTTGVTNFVLSPYSNRETYDSLVAYDGQNATLSLATSGTMQATQSTSAPAARNYGIKTWSGDDVFVATNDGTNFSPSRSGTLNMGSYTDAYLGVRVSNGVIMQNFNMKIQLELGSTATAYEPFVGGTPSPSPSYPQQIQTVTGTQTISINGTNYPISLGSLELCKLGSYQDYIYKDGDDWKVHKKCKTITLDGSEDWQYSSNYSFFYAGAITGMEIPVNAGVACYCRTHKGLTSSSSGPDFATEASGYSYAADVHTTQALARIKDTRFSSTQDFANWLTQNNTTIYYVVKSATDTAITDQTLIAQLEAIRTASLATGANTITNTATGTNLAGDMEIGYYGYNPRNRYDKWLWLDLNNNYEQIGS